MSVYVDPLQTTVRNYKWRYPQGCHLIADTEDELHAFATRLGLKRAWFQGDGTMAHYDLSPNKRKQAVRMGAYEITPRMMAGRIRAWRESRKEAIA